MQKHSYKALVVEESSSGAFVKKVQTRTTDELPQGELLIRVHYSSLNYKDALSASGNRGVTRHYPHVPGIDAAGVVEESTSVEFRPGDEVVASGFDLGMNTSGGYGQYIMGSALPQAAFFAAVHDLWNSRVYRSPVG